MTSLSEVNAIETSSSIEVQKEQETILDNFVLSTLTDIGESGAGNKPNSFVKTKIPHPAKMPAAAAAAPSTAIQNTMLITNVPFRRAASLRLRGTKSNLLSSHNAIQIDNNTPTRNLNQVLSEFATSTGFSQRRKVALRSTSIGFIENALQQNNRLTCSLSLQNDSSSSSSSSKTKNYLGHKTEPPNLISADNNAQLCVSNTSYDTLDAATDCDHNMATFKDISTSTDATLAQYNELELKTRNLSLQLNGDITATGNNYATTTKTSLAAAPKTSKTPQSTPQTPPESALHYCKAKHNQHAATPLSTTKLATVPETKISPKTPPVTPDSPSAYLDDDLDSMYSFATTTSGRSTMSCEHPYVARNGTTFSGRKMKYVVHCSNYAGQVGSDYLTPTQRAQRQIKRLKELLCIARHDLEQKDSEILRLTREVVELRLFKASLSSPEERSASSDAVTVREAELKTSQDVSPIIDMVDDATKSSPRHLMARMQLQTEDQQQQQLHAMQISTEMQSSFADSGHFEDLTTSSMHSKDSHTHDMNTDGRGSSEDNAGACSSINSLENYELQRQELIRMYEQRIEELIRTQDTAASDLKRSHNDKVEALLQKLAECNTRYADIVPDYEHAKERIRELEKQLEDLQRRLIDQEDKQKKMYLHMYQKGQEAERIARADQALELAHRTPNSKVSINELLHQLQSTQDELENIRTIYRRLLEAQKNHTHVDPEVTLQFLKSAVYYFLTDKENSQGHLQAIESILEFTEAEKQNINKARIPK